MYRMVRQQKDYLTVPRDKPKPRDCHPQTQSGSVRPFSVTRLSPARCSKSMLVSMNSKSRKSVGCKLKTNVTEEFTCAHLFTIVVLPEVSHLTVFGRSSKRVEIWSIAECLKIPTADQEVRWLWSSFLDSSVNGGINLNEDFNWTSVKAVHFDQEDVRSDVIQFTVATSLDCHLIDRYHCGVFQLVSGIDG